VESAWFPQLSISAQKQVRADVVERTVSAGDVLIHHGETALWWIGVMEGVLKWSTGTREGRSVTLGGLTAGSWFGEGSLLRGKPVLADIVALRYSRVAMLPKNTFEWLYDTEPRFGRFLLSQINERLHWFMGDFAAHRVMDVEAQVARALTGLIHPWLNPGRDLHLQISQEELANLVGLSRQRCNQALSHFKTLSVIRTEYGGITILDADQLELLARVE
jgi:CRP-like cAMP-binding protein